MQKTFRKIISAVLLVHGISAYASQAITPLRNRTPLLENLLKTSVATNLPMLKPHAPLVPIQKPIKTLQPLSLLSTSPQIVPQPQFTGLTHFGGWKKKGSWQQEKNRFINRDAIKKALGITAAVAITAVIAEASEIADTSSKVFSMGEFDESLISDEFSQAIVRIYGLRVEFATSEDIKQGTAFIVRGEKNPNLYFVLTAAHCVGESNTVIHIKNPQNVNEIIALELTTILKDPVYDIAVLLIPPAEVKKFQDGTKTLLPAIPASQLSNVKPHKQDVLVLQGYPGFVTFKDFYREKFKPGIYWDPYNFDDPGKQVLHPVNEPIGKLSGASGGPLITLRDNKPQIQGLIIQGAKRPDETSMVIASGMGKLSSYIREAEGAPATLEAEKKAHSQKSWWRSWLHW